MPRKLAGATVVYKAVIKFFATFNLAAGYSVAALVCFMHHPSPWGERVAEVKRRPGEGEWQYLLQNIVIPASCGDPDLFEVTENCSFLKLQKGSLGSRTRRE